MQADLHGSTGGNALAYDPAMRNTIFIPLSLSLAFVCLACGDDGEPTRPADHTVKAWESCVWDGQLEFSLCEVGLACSSHGVCSPTCEEIKDCPNFDGFDVECSENGDGTICRPRCNTSDECPKTGGVELHCFQYYCIGDS